MKEIIFTGDFYYNYEDIKSDVTEIFQSSNGQENYLIVNLEGALTQNGSKIKKRGPNLAQSDCTMDVLKKGNVFGVCLANNHIMDYGETALCNTLELLDAAGIQHTGAGRNLEEARKPIIINEQGTAYAIYNYGWDVEEVVIATANRPGCAPRDEKIILEDIAKSIEREEKVIVVMHWGFEYNLNPQPRDISLAHKIIDAGAELVIGHHPHVMQGYEKYKEKSIYYSLGNFYFSGMRNRFMKKFHTELRYEGRYGMLVHYDIAREKSDIEIVQYDENKHQSVVVKNSKYRVSDYTDIKCDRKYRKKLRREKENINPILYDNKIAEIKLAIFQIGCRKILRSIKQLLKKIIVKTKGEI